MIEISENQKKIIRSLGHNIYSVEYVEQFINNECGQANIVSDYIAAGCLGFYAAVQCIERQQLEMEGIIIK